MIYKSTFIAAILIMWQYCGATSLDSVRKNCIEFSKIYNYSFNINSKPIYSFQTDISPVFFSRSNLGFYYERSVAKCWSIQLSNSRVLNYTVAPSNGYLKGDLIKLFYQANSLMPKYHILKRLNDHFVIDGSVGVGVTYRRAGEEVRILTDAVPGFGDRIIGSNYYQSLGIESTLSITMVILNRFNVGVTNRYIDFMQKKTLDWNHQSYLPVNKIYSFQPKIGIRF